jgi:hypothetical protein
LRHTARWPGRPKPAIGLNEHFVGDGDIVYRQACKLSCEGIVSKGLGPLYPLWPIEALAQGQESEDAGSAARGGRGLGALTHLLAIRACASGKD